MIQANDLPKGQLRFHQIVSETPFKRFWSIDPNLKELVMDYDAFMAAYQRSGEAEQAFSHFLYSVWEPDHEEIMIPQFYLSDLRNLDQHYARLVSDWTAEPFWP